MNGPKDEDEDRTPNTELEYVIEQLDDSHWTPDPWGVDSEEID